MVISPVTFFAISTEEKVFQIDQKQQYFWIQNEKLH